MSTSHDKSNKEFGAHPVYGGESWGILHKVTDHHKSYTVNHGVVSKVEIDSSTGNIYIDKSHVPLAGNTVRWAFRTDNHHLAKLVWAHAGEITRILASLGFTSADEIDLDLNLDHNHNLALGSLDPRYRIRPVTVFVKHRQSTAA